MGPIHTWVMPLLLSFLLNQNDQPFYYAKSSKRQGLRTAWVNPLTYLSFKHWLNGTPLPVLDVFAALERTNPTVLARRADLASRARLAPKPKKLAAAAVDYNTQNRNN